MTSTEITLYGEEDARSLTFAQQYPGAVEPTTPAAMLDFTIMASEYTGGETVNVDRYLSTKLADGKDINQTVWLWGLLCYSKEMTDTTTGEVSSRVGVVFRLGDETGPSETFLSFTAVSAFNFVKRSILPLMKVGLVGIGDWQIGLPVNVWAVPLDKGRTYRFKLLKKEGNE